MAHLGPARTRLVAVHPPTGLARPGTGALPLLLLLIMPRCTRDGQLQHTGAQPQRKRAKKKGGEGTCSKAPHHRPRSTVGSHPTRCLPLPEPPLRRLGQRDSNLGPAALASRVLPLRHMALQPTWDTPGPGGGIPDLAQPSHTALRLGAIHKRSSVPNHMYVVQKLCSCMWATAVGVGHSTLNGFAPMN